MSNDTLPTQVNPLRLAENAAQLHGYLPIRDMAMLIKSLSDDAGKAEVDLAFGIDEQGVKYVQGHVEAAVNLQCQRCLEPFHYEIITDFLSGLITNEAAAKQLPERFDPCLFKDNELNIKDLIEEELILSLPIVPMHDRDHCKKTLPMSWGEEENANSPERESPFKVIESLKRRKE